MKSFKKYLLTTSAIILLAGSVFAKETVYISPNNDGVQDELVIPLSIKDKRYISEWELVIQDEKGNVIKRMGNKDRADDSAKTFFRGLVSGEGAKDFFKNVGSAFSPKKGVDVPSEVRWNGLTDSNEIASDGIYTYYFRAVDDNGNEAKSKQYKVVVDNTAPQIVLTQPSESAKIFGAGSKPSLTIKQSGSSERLWKADISDVNGKVVKSFTWENASPVTIEWDGKDDNENYVSEGVYSYQISSTDLAGNVSKNSVVSNIIYDAIPRTAQLNLLGSPFSPNGDGIKDNLLINIDVPNQSGMTSWKFQIADEKGIVYKTLSGEKDVPSQIDFNGYDDKGNVLLDGTYVCSINIEYNNGQTPSRSMKFTVDNFAPRVSVTYDTDILSPDNDGKKDTITFSQTTSKENHWNARIVDGLGNEIKSWSFVGIAPETVVWNGIDNKGNLAKEDVYYYEITATDEAGNTTTARTSNGFQLDVSKTELALHCEYEAFSPNGDKVQDTVCFVPIVKAKLGVKNYSLTIKNEKGKVVRDWTEEADVKNVFEWNGLDNEGVRCPEGIYDVSLKIESNSGNVTTTYPQSVRIDTTYPEIAKFDVDNIIFSPNGDGRKDETRFDMITSKEDSWKFTISDEKGNVVRQILWQDNPASFIWDGTNSEGTKVADGKYTAELSSMDVAGNKSSSKISDIVIDSRNVKAYITSTNEAFSPLAENDKSSQVFEIMVEPKDGIESWKVAIMDPVGKTVKSWSTEDQANLPEKIEWTGMTSDDSIANGDYIAKMDIVYAKGDEISSSTSSFKCVANAPKLKVQTLPKYFSPDNDGIDDDLFVKLKCESLLPVSSWAFEIFAPSENASVKSFWKTSGESTITDRLVWNGRSNSGELVQSATEYKYKFTVTDSIGLTSEVEGSITVDVLVIRDGDLLRILIPSIVFRANQSDFVGQDKDPVYGLTKEQIANNERVLKRIAEILNKFKEYNIVIEGHANNVSGTLEEGEKDIPLSEKRAEYVKARLVKYGVSAGRLTTVGRGGTMPIAPGNDKSVNWKNRRVEFILQK